MTCFNGQIKRKPLRSAPPVPSLELDRGGFFALLVEVAFGLHLSRLGKSHRRGLKLFFFFLFGSISFRLLLPLFRSEHVPVDRVLPPRQLIKRDKGYVLGQ